MGGTGCNRTEGATALEQEHNYTLDDVLSRGFEARCAGVDGTRYLWHGKCGLRVDSRIGTTTMIIDPEGLPQGPWTATVWGEEEIREGATR